MSIAARVPTTPRYGSPAEVASYAGLSVKTVRRLVDAGKVPGHRVGRRVLIPFDAMDRHILSFEDHRRDAMSAAAPQATLSRRSVDERGRLVPMTEAEVRGRAEVIARGLDALDDMGTEEEQRETLDALMRGLNEEPLSDRPRFRG
jgi:excisionase family DNA binding protein